MTGDPQHTGTAQADEDTADFVTIDLLREQLAVIDHYIATTPNTPFTHARRSRLAEEKAQLEKMIHNHFLSTHDPSQQTNSDSDSANSDGDGDIADPDSQLHSDLNTPPLLRPLLRHTDTGRSFGSGFSTPDLASNQFSHRDEDPFACVHEEPLSVDDRLAQELA
jgi:hypothetical protein